MSEDTQDEFAETSADKPAEEVLEAQTTQPQTPENTLPPEAQGETNGGPLGCCLGTMVGLLLSLSLAVFSRTYATTLGSFLQGNYWLLGLLVRLLMGILAVAFAIFFGYVGWKMGRRFYREYEQPTRKGRAKAKRGSRQQA